MASLADQLLGSLNRIAKDVLKTAVRQATGTVRKASGASRPASDDRHAPKLSVRYPGDFKGRPQITYAPHTGKTPDPGEVVTAWVPDEEDHKQGKDRPVLLVGRDGDWLLGVTLSVVDSGADAEAGRWVTIGTGAWDARRRPSHVRVDRIVRIHPDDVRGRAEKLDKTRFDKVAAGIRKTSI
jgi:mRNA-degrading endonuclease toxin of MazEF toxin-antitoxin module